MVAALLEDLGVLSQALCPSIVNCTLSIRVLYYLSACELDAINVELS